MGTNLKDIISNVKDIYESESNLATLLDFERVVDELDVYAFKNWKLGELVQGPDYEKYFVTCTFMWPYKAMPDPRGGEQLLNYNCLVQYKKDKLEFPIKVKSPDDFKPGTKVAKRTSVDVWLVSITMPKKLMTEIRQGAVELEDDVVDEQDLDRAYEEGLDTKSNSTDIDQAIDQDIGGVEAPGGAPGQMGAQGAPGQQQPGAM